MDLLKALRRVEEQPPIGSIDLETLRSRIGEPLPAKKPAANDNEYVRSDGRPAEERSWRRVAGLSR